MARVFLDVQFNKYQYPMVKQIQQFKPHFNVLVSSLSEFLRRGLQWLDLRCQARPFLQAHKLVRRLITTAIIMLLFSVLVKRYGDHDMVQSI